MKIKKIDEKRHEMSRESHDLFLGIFDAREAEKTMNVLAAQYSELKEAAACATAVRKKASGLKIKASESGGFKKIHYISAENGTVTTTVESSEMAMDALDLIQMSDLLKNVPGRLQDMFIFALDYDKFHSGYGSVSLPSFEGTARCHEEDEFNEKVGCIISSMKADRIVQRAAAKKYKDASAMLARLAEITADLAEKHYGYAEKLKEEASHFDASKIHKKEKKIVDE